MYRSPAHRGFSLTELLIVIALIAILAGLLLPAVNLVRASARAMACLSSQRQVAMACTAYGNDNEGLMPALYLSKPPASNISIFWSNLVIHYVESRKDVTSHDDFTGTVMQGCATWKAGRMSATDPNQTPGWECAYGMNQKPFCQDLKKTDDRDSDFVTNKKAKEIYFNQITRQSSRLLLADALNRTGPYAGQSTYKVWPQVGAIDESNNNSNCKSWHPLGKQVNMVMFDGHGERRSIAAAITAMLDPQ